MIYQKNYCLFNYFILRIIFINLFNIYKSMSRLQNKIVFITGCTSGIGKACAEIFASEGAQLLLCARRTQLLKQLAQELQDKYSIRIHTFALDVRDRRSVEKSLMSLPPEWQAIDILVNNAGLARGIDKVYEANVDDWEEMIDTNVKGLLYITKAVVKMMIDRHSGHIINIGSIAGHEAYTGGSVYCASKYAVNAITKSLRMDLLGTGIKVSTVDPGLVETEFSIVRFHGDKERAANVYRGLTPLIGKDIAEAVFFVASRPEHVCIAEMIVFPSIQACATMVYRKT